MRITVDPTTCFSSELSAQAWENRCSILERDDQPLAEGGQGKIYAVSQVDGRRVSDLLVKEFPEDFPSGLRDIVLAVRNSNARDGSIAKTTALRALPLFLFTGTLQGQPGTRWRQSVPGYVMRRVTGKRFSQILESEEDRNTYINVPLDGRLALCRQFLEGMDILYRLTIVHADLNAQNLMIDLVNRTMTIIDLDGGAVARNGTAPVVIGKPEVGWLAPEIWAKRDDTTLRQQIDVGIQVDFWSIACGVHFLLFGLAPFFFIAERPDIASYLRAYSWPQLRGLQGIKTKKDEKAFSGICDYYERAYKTSPAKVQRFLESVFQKGYLNPKNRPTAYQWLQALEVERKPPPQPLLTKVTCRRCRQVNDAAEIYCQHCAQQLYENQACRRCREAVPVNARYCPNCGGQL